MYYKIMNNNMLVDLLTEICWVRYLPNSKRLVITDSQSANCIMGSDKNTVYHINGRGINYLEDIMSVDIVKIKEDEYNYLATNISFQQEENKILRKEIDSLKTQLNEQSSLLQQILAKLS